MTNDTRRLIRDLITAGVPVKDTKAGWLIGAPDGSSISVHRTESDHRAIKNTMARLKRAGINLEKEQEDMDTKARERTINAVKKTLDSMGNPTRFSVSQVYGQLDMAPQTVYRALDQLGYHKFSHGLWAINETNEPATQIEEVAIDFAEVEAIPVREIVVTKAPAEREFIDTKESFTIDHKDIADMTVDQMARMFAVTGLSFEIRAWR